MWFHQSEKIWKCEQTAPLPEYQMAVTRIWDGNNPCPDPLPNTPMLQHELIILFHYTLRGMDIELSFHLGRPHICFCWNLRSSNNNTNTFCLTREASSSASTIMFLLRVLQLLLPKQFLHVGTHLHRGGGWQMRISVLPKDVSAVLGFEP